MDKKHLEFIAIVLLRIGIMMLSIWMIIYCYPYERWGVIILSVWAFYQALPIHYWHMFTTRSVADGEGKRVLLAAAIALIAFILYLRVYAVHG